MRQHYPWLVVTWCFFSVIGEGMVNKCDGRVYNYRVYSYKVCEGEGMVCEGDGMV